MKRFTCFGVSAGAVRATPLLRCVVDERFRHGWTARRFVAASFISSAALLVCDVCGTMPGSLHNAAATVRDEHLRRFGSALASSILNRNDGRGTSRSASGRKNRTDRHFATFHLWFYPALPNISRLPCLAQPFRAMVTRGGAGLATFRCAYVCVPVVYPACSSERQTPSVCNAAFSAHLFCDWCL